ncbi:hypothetical protein [Streptomyces kanasensis]|uniref:Uncharacterized protein n=1 Tax=Streptomyces kanasensis TaxID=936756 RepID=A0A100Y067_9ACTN|nr:hypothetical protein [Streptomyces kanasensis]KUH35244.1 hypothetical protein ATE80_30395 [Streptomyces kanasensis]
MTRVFRAPSDPEVRRLVEQTVHDLLHQQPDDAVVLTADTPADVDDLDAEDADALRTAARTALMYGDTGLITSLVDACGRENAHRLYGPGLVRYALRLAHASCHITIDGTQR